MDGWSRDRLLGLRLLFEWADVRPLRPLSSLAASKNQAETDERKPQRGGKGKGKAKKAVSAKKGKKKVEVNTTLSTTSLDLRTARDGGTADTLSVDVCGEASGWWMRDSVIEMLKGRAWLAGRE